MNKPCLPANLEGIFIGLCEKIARERPVFPIKDGSFSYKIAMAE